MNNNTSILLPSVMDLKPTTKIGEAHYVDKKQPISVFLAVQKIATFFKREMEFSSLQYVALEKMVQDTTDAYIWIDESWSDKFAVGACAFSLCKDVDESQKWEMQWVWFHPYYRNKGLLASAWKGFEEKYGKDFGKEPPISKAMQAFINKMESKK